MTTRTSGSSELGSFDGLHPFIDHDWCEGI